MFLKYQCVVWLKQNCLSVDIDRVWKLVVDNCITAYSNIICWKINAYRKILSTRRICQCGKPIIKIACLLALITVLTLSRFVYYRRACIVWYAFCINNDDQEHQAFLDHSFFLFSKKDKWLKAFYKIVRLLFLFITYDRKMSLLL